MCNHYLLVLFCIYVLAVSVVSREESSAILVNYLLKNLLLYPGLLAISSFNFSFGHLTFLPVVIIMLKVFDIIF